MSRDTRDPFNHFIMEVLSLALTFVCPAGDQAQFGHMLLDSNRNSSLQQVVLLSFEAEALMNRDLDVAAATALASVTPHNQQRRMQPALSLFLQQLALLQHCWQYCCQACRAALLRSCRFVCSWTCRFPNGTSIAASPHHCPQHLIFPFSSEPADFLVGKF